jgi:hypothetical protein
VSQGHPLQFRQPTPVSCPASAILRNPRTRLDRPAPEVRLPPLLGKVSYSDNEPEKVQARGGEAGTGLSTPPPSLGSDGGLSMAGMVKTPPPMPQKNFSTLRVCYVTLVTSTV